MSNLSVVLVGPKVCKPFIREIFSASPEPGYKFDLVVEKACTPENDPLWKLVFDFYKKDASGIYQQVVHVSFQPDDRDELRGIQALATEPVGVETMLVLRRELHPCAKEVAESANPTPAQRSKLLGGMSKVTRSALEL